MARRGSFDAYPNPLKSPTLQKYQKVRNFGGSCKSYL